MRSDLEQAVLLLRQGPDQDTEKALSLLQQTVFSFSMRVCGQREDAEDTMQDVLVRSLPYLAKFDSPKALVVWLYKVAKNRCLMSRRRSKFAPGRELSLEELMPERKEFERLRITDTSPEKFAIRSQEASRVRAAIQKLPPQYRIVLVLRDMEGLSDDEVAEIAGLRPGTVRVRLHRARLFIRKELMRSPSVKARTKLRSDTAPRPRRCKAMFAELSDYLDQELDDSLCSELEKHMAGCEPCQAFLANLEASIQFCRNAPRDTPARKKAEESLRNLLSQYEQLVSRSS